MPRLYTAEDTSYQVAIMAEEESSLQDPVLSHLLRHVRPMSVRHKLADVDPQRYTAAHEAVLLVSETSKRLQTNDGICSDDHRWLSLSCTD